MAKHLFIIGAQRSGTTYLYSALDAHPSVCMAKPVKPEPKYFMSPTHAIAGYDAYYKKYFSNAADATWLGEKSTSYIECAEAAFAIKRTIPDAMILVMLRDPVERAISNYRFTKDHGLEPYDIERAIQDEPLRKSSWHATGTSVSPYAYTERGKYAQFLESWERLFGKEKLVLLVAEQFIGNQGAVSGLYERLGIDSQFTPSSLSERVNASITEQHEVKLPVHLRASLRAMYQPWNRELEHRYGLDLSFWEESA